MNPTPVLISLLRLRIPRNFDLSKTNTVWRFTCQDFCSRPIFSCSGVAMKEQDLLRIVRNMLASVVDLMDSNVETEISAVLRNVRDGTAGFCSLLDEVIVEEVEDLIEKPEDEQKH